MDFRGLDVSLDETHICVVTESGRAAARIWGQGDRGAPLRP
ncbi:hypothetical protein C8J28_11885 [Cereibacter azotoformans]|uniref:Uncharacterized protein n=1 Tax=Cereibacter azotoformans TaxID=43057 RepID=A0A2T5JV73_9RHOB|nr:hypothetical protein C8J28_11885 [Cereibacter azotoformans]